MDGDGATRTVPETQNNNSTSQPPQQNLSTAKSLKKFIKRIVPSYLYEDSSDSEENDQVVGNLPQELEISLNSHTAILTKFISDSSTKTLFVEKVTIQSDASSGEEDNNDDKVQSPVETKIESKYRDISQSCSDFSYARVENGTAL